jgi:branched-chain amino acid transport system ATP-binding protein
VSGLIAPVRGEIRLAGERIDGRTAERIADLGIVHVMQGDGLFPDMSVEENLLMGAFPSAAWSARRAALDRVFDLFPQVHERRAQRARTLSGGERRLVALGRGLMREARLLLIDEPSLGLAPVMIDTVYRAIREIRERLDTTVLLVEENFTHIAGIADVVHVIEMGGIVRSGSFEELAADRTVVETYLGTL